MSVQFYCLLVYSYIQLCVLLALGSSASYSMHKEVVPSRDRFGYRVLCLLEVRKLLGGSNGAEPSQCQFVASCRIQECNAMELKCCPSGLAD